MYFLKVLILFLGSTSRVFQASMFKNIFFHIFYIVADSLFPFCQQHCLVPVSMKPLPLKSTMCSDWSAEPVCCDWSTASGMFQKCHVPYHNHEFQNVGQVTFKR